MDPGVEDEALLGRDRVVWAVLLGLQEEEREGSEVKGRYGGGNGKLSGLADRLSQRQTNISLQLQSTRISVLDRYIQISDIPTNSFQNPQGHAIELIC